jgi:hypothetical protein
MWLYTHKGFLSIVQDFKDESLVIVRGKFKEDIQTYFPSAKVKIDTDTDYKFRTSLPKVEVAERLWKYVLSELNVRRWERKKPKEKKIS